MMLRMYRRMVCIREFELACIDLFLRGQIKGAATTCNGMEASAVGVCMALRKEDLIASTHRGHGHAIAKGADLRRMAAEVFGKETGYCKGRGGSMHIAAFETGSLGALPVNGAGIPIAVGAALAFKTRREERVAVAFIGDGATNTGSFHEGLNLASVWQLPFVLVVENNQYAVSTRIRDAVAVEDLSVRAHSYGIPGVRVDGFNVLAVYEAMLQAAARARQGEGPTLLVTECYRFEGHYAGEPQVYREQAEIQEYLAKDPIPRFREYLLREGVANQAQITALETEIGREISEAVTFARESPEPDPTTALDYNYAP
jgi:TPP-dependent pyruvate/acetoin dehydrogenase alpha subunit